MRGKRELLADLLFKTRLTGTLSRFVGHGKLIVLNYHRIHPGATTATTPFDEGVFSTNADQFFRQMKWLKRHAQILSEQDLVDQMTAKKSADRKSHGPSVVITFDDGYRDNYSVAFPILRSLQIPAFFFICTEMIRERKLRWWDVLAYLIKKSPKPTLVVHEREHDLRSDRRKVIEDLQSRMKQLPYEQISNDLRMLSEASEIDLPSGDLQDRELMTQEQIREMAEHGMAIGSHTHTHRALSSCDDRLCQSELSVSKELLEQTTGLPVQSISYPFGLHQYIPLSIQEMAGRCGYKLGFTSNFGINYLRQANNMALNRFSGELEKVSTVSLITVWPELFACKDEAPLYTAPPVD